jgi:hypothetical protein
MSKMDAKTSNCVREYVKCIYQGGLIGISDMAIYCHILEGELFNTLLSMQSDGELKVIKRYFCPEFHQIDIADKKSHCQSCEFTYPNEQLEVAIYVEPLKSETLR